jgi:hypothetical protein
MGTDSDSIDKVVPALHLSLVRARRDFLAAFHSTRKDFWLEALRLADLVEQEKRAAHS